MALATLSIDLVAKLANLEAGFTKAQQLAEKNSAAMQAAFQQTADAAKTIGAAVGAAFSIKAIVDFVTSTIDAADHLHDLAARSQTTVEEIGALGFAASQAGSNVDEVTAAIGKFNQTISKAAAGDKDAKALFQTLGVDIRDSSLALKTQQALLIEVASAFSTYADGPKKGALANALFSKGYQSILPMLADGGVELQNNVEFFGKFSGVTTAASNAADKFNDTIGKIKLISQGTRNAIVAEIIDPMQAVADAILQFREEGSKVSVIGETFKVVFQTIAVLGANVTFVLVSIGREIGAVAAQMVALARLDIKGFHAISDAVKEDGVRARAELDKLEARIMQVGAANTLARLGITPSAAGAGRGSQGVPAKREAPDVPGNVPGAPAISDIDKLIQKYKEMVDAALHVGDANKEMADAERALSDPKFKNITDGKRQAVLDLADALHFLRVSRARDAEDVAEALKHDTLEGEGLAALKKQADDAAVAFAGLISATPTAKINEFNALLDTLQKKLDGGQITAQQYAEVFNDAFAKIPEAIKPVLTEMEEFTKDAARKIQSALGDTIFEAFKGNTKGILATWGDMLLRMASEAAAANIAKALFGTGGTGGAVASIFGAIFGVGKASGGTVDAFSVQPVNERGPELLEVGGRSMLMMGSQGGRVVPNNMLGGSGAVTINMPIAAGVSRGELTAMVPSLTQHIKAEVMQTMRRPGFQRT